MARSMVLANLGSFILPVTMAGILPYWMLPAFSPLEPITAASGALLFLAGFTLLVWTISLFICIGRGTLAPWDPTRKLVVVGPFAHVRNPMISGVLAMILGEAISFRARPIAEWAGLFFLINTVYFLILEEPGLVRRFGAEYQQYRKNVPRWIPRATPWRPEAGQNLPSR